jgi:hypothetical protein
VVSVHSQKHGTLEKLSSCELAVWPEQNPNGHVADAPGSA